MPLFTLKKAAEELGYRSVESIWNLDRRGVLKIIRIPGRVYAANRVDSVDIDRIKRGEGPPAKQQVPAAAVRRRPPAAKSEIKIPKRPTVIRHYA